MLFVVNLTRALQELKPHHFLAKKQEENFKNQLQSLPPGQLLVIMDFAENYCFKSQNSVQTQGTQRGDFLDAVSAVTIRRYFTQLYAVGLSVYF